MNQNNNTPDTSEAAYLVEKLAGRTLLMFHISGSRFNNQWVDEIRQDVFCLKWDERRFETYEEWANRLKEKRNEPKQ